LLYSVQKIYKIHNSPLAKTTNVDYSTRNTTVKTNPTQKRTKNDRTRIASNHTSGNPSGLEPEEKGFYPAGFPAAATSASAFSALSRTSLAVAKKRSKA